LLKDYSQVLGHELMTPMEIKGYEY